VAESRRQKFDPSSFKPLKLSRSRLEMFMRCSRCFYLDTREGIKSPKPYPYSLNSAVDRLLKNEFDIYRAQGKPHPLMQKHGINGIPFAHPQLEVWRHQFEGMSSYYVPAHCVVTGALDDPWFILTDNALAVADYKSTSVNEPHPIGSTYWDGFKRQLEIYAWLLARQETGYPVASTHYFVFANAKKDLPAFNATLHFDMEVIAVTVGSLAWVEEVIVAACACLRSNTIPPLEEKCDLCRYQIQVAKLAKEKSPTA